MRYFLEKNTKGSDNWEPCRRSDENPIEHDNLERIIVSLRKNYSDLCRWIWPLRVVNEEGYIFCVYDPERDTRLPGCRWRIIQRNAYCLWEKHEGPELTEEFFWKQAESELLESDGVYLVEGTYEWHKHLDQG